MLTALIFNMKNRENDYYKALRTLKIHKKIDKFIALKSLNKKLPTTARLPANFLNLCSFSPWEVSWRWVGPA